MTSLSPDWIASEIATTLQCLEWEIFPYEDTPVEVLVGVVPQLTQLVQKYIADCEESDVNQENERTEQLISDCTYLINLLIKAASVSEEAMISVENLMPSILNWGFLSKESPPSTLVIVTDLLSQYLHSSQPNDEYGRESLIDLLLRSAEISDEAISALRNFLPFTTYRESKEIIEKVKKITPINPNTCKILLDLVHDHRFDTDHCFDAFIFCLASEALSEGCDPSKLI